MAIDLEMEEILEVFFQECAEGLDAMESGLLHLDANADRETINTIFRAAHSIKGGAGTFGFMEISDFTHAVETLLDEMRNGSRPVTPDAVEVLLQAVDVMREMVDLAKAKRPIVSSKADDLTRKLAAILAHKQPPAQDSTNAVSHAAAAAVDKSLAAAAAGTPVPCWRIEFRPHVSLFKTCNDPLRIFGQLATLGALEVVAHVDAVPAFADLDPTECHLAWTLTLTGAIEKPQLMEVFEWVDANSSVEFHPVPVALAAAVPVTAPAGVLAAAPAPAPAPAAVLQAAAPAAVSAAVPAPMPAAVSVPVPAALPATAPGAADEPETSPPGSDAHERAAASALQTRPAPAAPSAFKASAEAGSIRVATEKVDALINLVGELIITQSMLSNLSDRSDSVDIESLRRGLAALARNTRELQESVLNIRMLPISFSFNRIPRLVHELSRKLGKKVELRLRGENTELDKTVLEKIGDPLTHLVRNSLDHGLETPEKRRAAGKDETGILELSASHQGGSIIIEVKDDGGGLDKARILAKAHDRGLIDPDAILTDEQIYNLIFAAGFSTSDTVSDVSGRGVGMDVVRRNITDLGGQVQLFSTPGKGSTVRIRLPLTLAILEGQMLRVGKEIYVISLVSIIETVQAKRERIQSIGGTAELFRHREEYIPIIRLHELFSIEPDSRDIASGLLIVAESDGHRVAIFVDELLAQQQVVIKSLETNLGRVPGLAGATIHGDGTVALILDVPGLIGKFLGSEGLQVEMAA
jgi:two-component system chemotaxis sensor kinase CheA